MNLALDETCLKKGSPYKRDCDMNVLSLRKPLWNEARVLLLVPPCPGVARKAAGLLELATPLLDLFLPL